MEIDDIILNKIDIFMEKNIINNIAPDKIFWWISVSGGKDSYTLALALLLWYKKNNYVFNGEGIFINQWNKDNVYNNLCKKIDWMPIRNINAVKETFKYTNYKFGMQAPCSKCSQVRKDMGEKYIMKYYRDGYYNILARGSHLTDMAISYLWRNFWGIDTAVFAKNLEKGKPFQKLKLDKEVFLAKPLCLVREYECERFSDYHQYKAMRCVCPAYTFPSRRDIVEESLRQLFDDTLWEFNVYGINIYLNTINAEASIKEYSLQGKESKCPYLTIDFIEYALKYWKTRIKQANILFDASNYIDDIGYNYLVNNIKCTSNKIYMPKLLSGIDLDKNEKAMIATVGPLWGAIGYSNRQNKEKILGLQNEICNIKIDKLWSQVNFLLQSYYNAKERSSTKDEKAYIDSLCDCHFFSNSVCRF